MTERTPHHPRRIRTRAAVVVVAAIAATGVVSVADATSSAHDPIGTLDALVQTGTGVHVTGWAIDRDSHLPLSVTVTVNGATAATTTASVTRSGLAKNYAKYGTNHGYSVSLKRNPGTAHICVSARNKGLGSNQTIGCRTITVSFNPHGSLDPMTQIPGGLTLLGAASDPNTSGPIGVNIYADNKKMIRVVADKSFHGGHGYSATLHLAEGRHTICAQGLNVGAGTHAMVGCRAITLNFSPSGAIGTLSQSHGGIHITGWAQDPDTASPVQVLITANGVKAGAPTAKLTTTKHPKHSFDSIYTLSGGKLVPGIYRVCATALNLGTYGENHSIGCKLVALNSNPVVGIYSLKQTFTGVSVHGWAVDKDTGGAIQAKLTLDGVTKATVTANGRGSQHTLHNLTTTIAAGSGTHKVCVVGINVLYGSGNSGPACMSTTLHFNPIGVVETAKRVPVSHAIIVSGWALDPNTATPIKVQVSVGGKHVGGGTAKSVHTGIGAKHPGYGSDHGYSIRVPAGAGEQHVCVTALNVSSGANTSLGCKTVIAVHPEKPSAPRSVTATAGYGSAHVSWKAPASDGGAPWSYFKIRTTSGTVAVRASKSATSATVTGLRSKTTYRFTVIAINMMGGSAAGTSARVTTMATPPPQTTPAPISTSRYVRNVRTASSGDLSAMKREGAADAARNPAGHRYLVLLDIGGQDQADAGVVLSAGVRFVSYTNLVKDVDAYVDGYASKQKANAPVVIAVGTNNDMDVSAGSGATWANTVVDKVVAHAAHHASMTIAGANDIEPGFSANYTHTKAWLSGYLSATPAPFVFNGSADGCNWTRTNGGCNNGWSAAGMYNLAAGMSPHRIINLPQIYNNTMAEQWKYISLTGVSKHEAKVNFGGPLTEYTACHQAGSCGSLTGHTAWARLWSQLRSSASLRPSTLPYSTDLRIDS